MNNDGRVVIGTELDTKQLEKQLKDLERDLRKLQREEDKLFGEKSNYEASLSVYENEKRKIKETNAELQKYQDQMEEIKRKREEMFASGATGKEVIAAGYGPGVMNEINEKRRIALQNALSAGREEPVNKKLQETQNKLSKINLQIEDNAKEQSIVNEKIIEMNNQLNNTKGFGNIQKSIDKIGSSVSGVIKKVGKWALAVFSIRSAYTLVRQAVSTLSQYNEQIATDIEYVRFAIATTLQPVVEAIIRLVYQLLGLINSIAKAWFGVDLFANASADAFNRNKKAVAGTNKQAKELQKTLAGFDEMNILQEDGSTAVGGGGGGIVSPSIDLSKIGTMNLGDIDKLLDRIKIKFHEVFSNIVNNIIKVFRDLGFSERFLNLFSNTFASLEIMINGLIDFIVGNVKIVVGFLTGDTELVKQGFEQALKGMKNLLFGFFNYMINSIQMLPQLVLEAMRMLADYVYKNAIVPIGDWFKKLPDDMTKWISNGVKNINNWFAKIPDKLREVKDKVVDIFSKMAIFVGNAVGDAFKSVINAVLNRVETVLNKPISTINALIGAINQLPNVNIGKLQNFKLPRLAQGGILNMPGRGVMVGSAIAGERGQEGVIPLTNSQQMTLLGEAIGKYITVNLTNVTELDGRTIARKVQEVNNNTNFLLNR